MTHTLIVENVDIFRLPTLDLQHREHKEIQITIGDLHGNAMKLMFMLVKHGIATNIDEAEYKELVRIYETSVHNLTVASLEGFNRILSKVTFNSACLVRLIGDELADRGSNDYFTLKIIEKLHISRVPVEIILSNHSIEFIEARETQNNFHAPLLRDGHAQSMENLQILVEKGIVRREEIWTIADTCYKPNLRAISYSLSEDKTAITIYSHAGIGLNTIQSLADKLSVAYQDSSASDLAQTIEIINQKFQEHVRNNTVNSLYTREQMYRGYQGCDDLRDAPFEFIMWNRLYQHIHRPISHNRYSVYFAHGHDSRVLTRDNVYNLDNQLGKPEQNSGRYSVLYSQESKLTPVMRLTESKETEFSIDPNQSHSQSSPWKLETAPQVINPVSLEETKSQNLPRVGAIITAVQPTETEKTDPLQNNPTVTTPLASHRRFLSQLSEIKLKEEKLRENHHIAAADCAENLHIIVNNQYNELINDKIKPEIFKRRCIEAIKTARPELERHRGWKQVLGNLALAVIGLGVFYVAAVLINKATTGKFLFFKTDSAIKIDRLQRAVTSIGQPNQGTYAR